MCVFSGSKAFGSCSDEANERPVKTKRQALFCCLARFLSHGGFPWARCDPTSSVTALQFFLLLNSFLQKLYFKTCRRLSEIVCFQAQHRSETSRLKKKKRKRNSSENFCSSDSNIRKMSFHKRACQLTDQRLQFFFGQESSKFSPLWKPVKLFVLLMTPSHSDPRFKPV